MSKRRFIHSQNSVDEKVGYCYEDDGSSSLAGDQPDDVPLLQSNNDTNTLASEAEYSTVCTIVPSAKASRRRKGATTCKYKYSCKLSLSEHNSESGSFSMSEKGEGAGSKHIRLPLAEDVGFTRDRLNEDRECFVQETDEAAMDCAARLFEEFAKKRMKRYPDEKITVERK